MDQLALSERQKRILNALRSNKPTSLKELSQRVRISDSTLRRDLFPLVDSGLVTRQFGSVQLAYSPDVETPFVLRATINEEEKRRIARAAVDLIQEGDSIFISGGTTTRELAQLLPLRQRLTVITNALPVANAVVGKPGIKLVILGGEVRRDEQNMHGHLTLFGVDQLRAELLFYGIEAISLEHGLTHSHLIEVSTDRALIRACSRTIVLADNSKFGKVAPAVVAPLSQVHTIITGRGLAQAYVDRLREQQIQLILV